MRKLLFLGCILFTSYCLTAQVLYINGGVTYAREEWLVNNSYFYSNYCQYFYSNSGTMKPGMVLGAEMEFMNRKSFSIIPGISYYTIGYHYPIPFANDFRT